MAFIQREIWIVSLPLPLQPKAGVCNQKLKFWAVALKCSGLNWLFWLIGLDSQNLAPGDACLAREEHHLEADAVFLRCVYVQDAALDEREGPR